MARKQRALQIKIRGLRRPRSQELFVRGLQEAMDTGDLRPGWSVELFWRNPDTKRGRSRNWQGGPFNEVLDNSGPGFSSLVARALNRELRRVRRAKAKPISKTKRAKTKKRK